jgi:hypothetical protein
MSTPEEILTATKSEIVSLIDKLPIEKLQPLRDYLQQEAKKLEPAIMEAESRLKTIAKHLWTCIQTGEHAVVTDVHNFLVARGKIVPFTPPAPVPSQAPETVQDAPAAQQDATAAPAPTVQA